MHLLFNVLLFIISLIPNVITANQQTVSLQDLKQMQMTIDNYGYQYRTGTIIIYDNSLTEVPKLNVVPINTDINDKSVCIVTYSSLNPPYSFLPSLLFKTLQSKFKGHLLHRKGGWPNDKDSCYSHATSGYGFKVCAIQEAYDLGYKKVLWLDSIIEAVRDLSPLFKFLDRHPCLYRCSPNPFKKYINESLINEFEFSDAEQLQCKHIASGVLGFNFNFPVCKKALHIWHETTKKNLDWPCQFPEQLLISIIFHRLRLNNHAFGSSLLKIGPYGPRNHILKLNAHRKGR